jgi:phage gp16-like protein
LTSWKIPFCDFVPSAVKHLCVKAKAAKENIAEVPSVINDVWRKTFRITAKRRKSPNCRQKARRQNKDNRHRTRKTLDRCLFLFINAAKTMLFGKVQKEILKNQLNFTAVRDFY